MSAENTIYSGLSWFGRAEAKLAFYGVLAFSVIFLIMIIINITSQIGSVRNQSLSPEQRAAAKKKLTGLLKLFAVLFVIFGVVLGFLYWNMKETERSKGYAAATGAVGLFEDLDDLSHQSI